MTTKLVSIRDRNGNDLTPNRPLRPSKTISQRQAIKRICKRADPPIWPVVERRLMEATKPTTGRLLLAGFMVREALIVVVCVAVIGAVIWRTF